MSTITIYSQTNSTRLHYACNIIFKIILKQDYKIITESMEPKEVAINYSSETVSGAVNIHPNGLLDQTGVGDFNLEPKEWEGVKSIFHSGKGDIPFDVFSAVFFLCSRYEEYLPFEGDEHGRYKAEDSTAWRFGFIQEPVVEQWAQLLTKLLKIDFPGNEYQYQLTVDVDDAWKYKGRSLLKTKLLFVRDFITFGWKTFGERIAVVLGGKRDPWDTFKYIGETEKNLQNKVRYFFLLGNKHKNDSSIKFSKKAFNKLVAGLQVKNKVGIHPSYASNESEYQLWKEYTDLSFIVKNKPLHSRQHYLKLAFPHTFQQLIKLGIVEDYSLGWSSQIGFRTGCSRPVPFYDISEEKETHLMLVPLLVMDRTLKDYLQLSPDEAIKQVALLRQKVQAVGGQFTVLWHNNALSNHGEWEGWLRVFEATTQPDLN